MTDKELIKAEIERLIELNEESAENTKFGLGKVRGLQQILSFVNSLPEEPVSEDLESKITELSKRYPEVSFAKLSRIAVSVAKWQKQQTIDKAKEWLRENAKNYVYWMDEEFGDEDLVEDFRKSLEEDCL